MADTNTNTNINQGNINITPEELAKSFKTYRQKFVAIPFMAMQDLLQYTNVMTGIRYQQVVPEMSGNFQMGNYDPYKKNTDQVGIGGRIFETFFGNSVNPVNPNSIYQSIFGSNITKGEGLKNVPIVAQVAAYIIKSIWENVRNVTFTAKHDATDTKQTSKWFNGFKTVLDADITAGKISEAKNNLTYGTTPINETNAVDIIKKFCQSAHETLRGQDNLELFIKDSAYWAYLENYQALHGSLPYNTDYTKISVEGFSNIKFVPKSYVPEDFMLLTPKKNIYCVYNQRSDDEGYIVERSLDSHYLVDVVANAFFGTQFETVNPRMLKVWEKKTA